MKVKINLDIAYLLRNEFNIKNADKITAESLILKLFNKLQDLQSKNDHLEIVINETIKKHDTIYYDYCASKSRCFDYMKQIEFLKNELARSEINHNLRKSVTIARQYKMIVDLKSKLYDQAVRDRKIS